MKITSGEKILMQLQTIGGNFSPLGIRNIRVYMIGQSVNLLGDWMQATAQAWVVWELTHRATSLGIVAFLSQIPFFIFGPWVGVFSDRFDRRKILLLNPTATKAYIEIKPYEIQIEYLKELEELKRIK